MPLLIPSGVALLPQRVQSAQGTSATASVSATFAATPKVGSLLVACVYANVTSFNFGMTGFAAQILNDSPSVQGVVIFTKMAGPSESATLTATATSATNMRIHVIEYSNVGSADPATTGSGDTTAGTTNVISFGYGVSPMVTVAFVAAAGNMGGWVSWSAGFTTVETEVRSQSSELISSVGALTSVTGTWTTARDAAGVLATFPGVIRTGVRPQLLQAVNRASNY